MFKILGHHTISHRPNFVHNLQHPPQATSSPSFPNSVPGSGSMGFGQGSQPVMQYGNQAAHPSQMGYQQVMVPQQQMIPQVPQVPNEHTSDLQVSVALLESLVEATQDQVQTNDETERYVHSLIGFNRAVNQKNYIRSLHFY